MGLYPTSQSSHSIDTQEVVRLATYPERSRVTRLNATTANRKMRTRAALSELIACAEGNMRT